MKNILLLCLTGSFISLDFYYRGQTVKGFDPNALQVIGVPDPNMTYDEVMSGYLGLDAFEKIAFKIQIGYLEDASYIVYINQSGKKFHRSDCRYTTETSRPVLRSSVERNGYTACLICKP
jgi:hypothetical protein